MVASFHTHAEVATTSEEDSEAEHDDASDDCEHQEAEVDRDLYPGFFQICRICLPHDNSYPAKHGRRAPGVIATAALLDQPHTVANRPCKAPSSPRSTPPLSRSKTQLSSSAGSRQQQAFNEPGPHPRSHGSKASLASCRGSAFHLGFFGRSAV
ncbi:hypothetical protein cypCar_00031837 [Cyprinus carpio]|nr:hypothetical protein cypCar_00031837 [Cyprinus carpio]